MSNAKPKIIFFAISFLLLLAIIFGISRMHLYQPVKITIEVKTGTADTYQLFYDTGRGFNEAESVRVIVLSADDYQPVVFVLPPVALKHFRIDPGSISKLIEMKKITLEASQQSLTWTPKEILTEFTSFYDFTRMTIVDNRLRLEITGNDPQFVYAQNIDEKIKLTDEGSKKRYFILTILLFFIGIMFILFRERVNEWSVGILKVTRGEIKRYLIFSALTIPPILSILYVLCFGSNVPFWDQWSIVPLFEKFQMESLTFNDFFSQNNEHRIFFPKIVMLFLGIMTKYNTVAEMLFTQVLMIVVLVLVCIKVSQQVNFQFNKFPLWVAVLPLLIFSWRQHENFLWGFQVTFIMPLTCAVISFYFLHKLTSECETRRTLKLILSILFAVIASFSSSMGLIIWIAGMPFFLLINNKKGKIAYLFVWLIMATITWLAYFANYYKLGHHPALSHAIAYPGEFLLYFFALTGSSLGVPYFGPRGPTIYIGIMINIISVFVIYLCAKYKIIKQNVFWLCFYLFSFLVLLSISVGRVGFGINQAGSSRYSTYSIMMIVSVFVLLCNVDNYSNLLKKIKLLHVISVLLIVGVLISNRSGLVIGKDRNTKMQIFAAHLKNIENATDDELSNLYADTKIVRSGAMILKKLKYNVFKISEEN